MLRTLDLRGRDLPADLAGLLPRAATDPGSAQAVVTRLIADVVERARTKTSVRRNT